MAQDIQTTQTARFVVDGRDVVVQCYLAPSKDHAIVVAIETVFEPNGLDGGPGLRVLVNDADVVECRPQDFVAYGVKR